MTTRYNLNNAHSDKFELVFPPFPIMDTLGEAREFSMNIFDSVMPGMSIPTQEEHWMGALHHRPMDNIEFQPYNVSFVVDENWENWYFLFKWLNFINNNKDNFANRKSDLTINPNILLRGNFNNLIMKITLFNAFPTELGEVSLNYRNGQEFLESSFTLLYDYYEIEKS